MKRLIADLLRNRTPWQMIAIACATIGLGLYVVYTSYTSTLKQFKPALIALFATGVTALLLAIFRRVEAARDPAAPRVPPFLAAILGLAGLMAFVTYSLGHHRRDMVAGCNAARLPDTLPGRQAAQDRAEAALRSPFAWLPALLSDEAARECATSRDDLARVPLGLCTKWPLIDHPCNCGAERYPYPRCSEPRCLYEPDLPDRFDCPGDPIPAGYTGF